MYILLSFILLFTKDSNKLCMIHAITLKLTEKSELTGVTNYKIFQGDLPH